MTTLEQVEKLRTRANVGYEEAKEALDACGGDLLDAMIYLENAGKVPPPSGGGSYSAASPPPAGHENDPAPPRGETFGQLIGRFLRYCRGLLYKGNRNLFEVWRHGALFFSLPITVLVLLIIISFWVVIPLLVIGLFFGFRYRFAGQDLDGASANKAANKVMDSVAQGVKTFQEEMCAPTDTPPDENN